MFNIDFLPIYYDKSEIEHSSGFYSVAILCFLFVGLIFETHVFPVFDYPAYTDIKQSVNAL